MLDRLFGVTAVVGVAGSVIAMITYAVLAVAIGIHDCQAVDDRLPASLPGLLRCEGRP